MIPNLVAAVVGKSLIRSSSCSVSHGQKNNSCIVVKVIFIPQGSLSILTSPRTNQLCYGSISFGSSLLSLFLSFFFLVLGSWFFVVSFVLSATPQTGGNSQGI